MKNQQFKKVIDVNTPKKKSNKTFLLVIILSFISGIFGGGFFNKVIFPFVEGKLAGSDAITISDKIERVTVEENSAVIDVVEKASPSVVTIMSKNYVYGFFGQKEEQTGAGTGFILTSDGMIITNKHVVSEDNAEYTVITSDGNDYGAKVLARDPLYDIAILKIEAKDLKVADLGDSDDLKVGQRVVAIGNALGEFENSVTVGVISGKGRPIVASDAYSQESEVLEGLLQTDAAINPGNSGGPLINISGQVIGINTAVADAENIGFAIPVNIAKPAIDSVIKTGKITRPMFGVHYITITKDIASAYDLPTDKGILVYSGNTRISPVVVGGPAYKAGIRAEDIITEIDSEKIDRKNSFVNLIQKYSPKDEVEVTYLRDGKESKTKVILEEITG